MAIDPNIFGTAYLDTENFRAGAALFGVGMSLCDYPATEDGDAKLTGVLQAASRVIDAETGLTFTPGDHAEQHHFDFATRQVKLNNHPVAQIVSFRVIFSPGSQQTFQSSDIYINNQLGYIELTDIAVGFGIITEYLSLGLTDPVAEIVYKSFQDVPQAVKLACGYQAAKMINDGYVDKELPANFGAIDLDGIKINNRKGFINSKEQKEASVLDPTAARLLAGFKRISVR